MNPYGLLLHEGERSDLDGYLAAEAGRVENVLTAVAASLPADVPEVLREPMRYALATRGKRLRPILCVAAYRAVARQGGEAVYRVASALEIVHTYSLVHDDLPCMDDDDLRRGRPTVHRVFGARRAMLAGAALLPLAVHVLDMGAKILGLNVATRGRLLVELCQAAGAEGMVGGQLFDLEAELQPVDSAGLERIHRAKTGALLAASLRIGALAAGAGAARLAALTSYGQALGLAFQIVDDVLDVTGDAAQLGKTARKDQSAGKATYPALFGLDEARRMAAQRADEAVEALRGGGVDSPVLEALARFVVERRR